MSTPISWIRLERYHLGESDSTERARIEASLTDCAISRERLAQIQQDARPLPALPTAPVRRWSPAWGGLALAAALLLAVLVPRGNTPKGGDVAITLVRERAGSVTVAPESYRDGDRISIRLTCPSGSPTVTVVVSQGEQRHTPIPEQSVVCGNQVPLSGAFRATGPGDLMVCVTAGGREACEGLVLE